MDERHCFNYKSNYLKLSRYYSPFKPELTCGRANLLLYISSQLHNDCMLQVR